MADHPGALEEELSQTIAQYHNDHDVDEPATINDIITVLEFLKRMALLLEIMQVDVKWEV